MAASAACLARAHDFSTIDHLLLSISKEARGENVFVVQGEQGDPEYRRAVMKTQAPIDTPVEQSLAQLRALNEAAQRQSQARAQERDEPMRQTQPQCRSVDGLKRFVVPAKAR